MLVCPEIAICRDFSVKISWFKIIYVHVYIAIKKTPFVLLSLKSKITLETREWIDEVKNK